MQNMLLTCFLRDRLGKLLMLGCATVMLCFANAWSDELPRDILSKALLAAIRKVSPNATVLQANQVDAKECNPVPRSPGLARADFNGDGLEDVAVLLTTRVANEITPWEGKELREANFVFVLFLNNGKDGYSARILDRFDDFIPAALVITIRPPGKIRPRGTTKDITLSNPAFVLSFCGKSEAAYAVTGNRVKVITISD